MVPVFWLKAVTSGSSDFDYTLLKDAFHVWQANWDPEAQAEEEHYAEQGYHEALQRKVFRAWHGEVLAQQVWQKAAGSSSEDEVMDVEALLAYDSDHVEIHLNDGSRNLLESVVVAWRAVVIEKQAEEAYDHDLRHYREELAGLQNDLDAIDELPIMIRLVMQEQLEQRMEAIKEKIRNKPRVFTVNMMSGAEFTIETDNTMQVGFLKAEVAALINQPRHRITLLDGCVELDDRSRIVNVEGDELTAVVCKTCARGCCPNYDIRVRCEPRCYRKNSAFQLNDCVMKVDTLAYHLENDQDTYRSMPERDLVTQEALVQRVLAWDKKIELTDEEALELYQQYVLLRFGEEEVAEEEEPVEEVAEEVVEEVVDIEPCSTAEFLEDVAEKFGAWAVSQEPVVLPKPASLEDFYKTGVFEIFVTCGKLHTILTSKVCTIQNIIDAVARRAEGSTIKGLKMAGKHLDAKLTCKDYGITKHCTLHAVVEEETLPAGGKRGRAANGASKVDVVNELADEIDRGLGAFALARAPALAAARDNIAAVKLFAMQAPGRCMTDAMTRFTDEQLQDVNKSIGGTGSREYKATQFKSIIFANDITELRRLANDRERIESLAMQSLCLCLVQQFGNERGEVKWDEVQTLILNIERNRPVADAGMGAP